MTVSDKIQRVTMLITVAAASLTLVATNARADNTPAAHMKVLEAAQNTGVAVLLNPPHCLEPWAEGARGFYFPSVPALVVCQEGNQGKSEVLPLSNDDLITIRHEGHHLVQDCLNGLGDGELTNMFSEKNNKGDTMGLVEFIRTSGLSNDYLREVVEITSSRGGSDKTISLELEAHSVAHSIEASMIASAVEDYCQPSE